MLCFGPLIGRTGTALEMRGRNADVGRAVAKCEKPVIRQAGSEGKGGGGGVRG